MKETEIIPSAYRDIAVIHELSAPTWQQILRHCGMDIPDESATHHKLKEILSSKARVPTKFVEALRALHCLGTVEGRSLIEQAADDIAFNLNFADDQHTDRDVAIQVWVRAHQHDSYRDVLQRALATYDFLHRTHGLYEFSGDSSFDVTEINPIELKTLISKWCTEKGKSEVVELKIFSVDEFWCCSLVRGDPIRNIATIDEKKVTSVSFQPAVYEFIRIDPTNGHIFITARSKRLVNFYKETLGQMFCGNAAFFSGENICTLKPLQSLREAVFKSLPAKIQRIDLIELKWRGNLGDTVIVKGRNCFKILSDLRVDFKTGDLVEAKFIVHLVKDSKPTRLTIKVPQKIDFSDERHKDVINRYLEKIGIRGNFNPSLDKRNFWELHPWVLTETNWRQHIGDHFDILKKANCFLETECDVVRHPNHHTSAGDMHVEYLTENTQIAMSDDPDMGMRTVTPSDIEGYELNIDKLLGLLASKLGHQGQVSKIEKDLWHLGQKTLNSSVTVNIYFASGEPTPSTSHCIEKNTGASKAVLFIPSNCQCDAIHTCIPINLTSLYYDEALADIIKALGLEDRVDPLTWRSDDLILHPQANKAWYKKVEIPDVDFNEHPFKFAMKVAEAGGECVLITQLDSTLSPSSTEPGVAKQAKHKFNQKIQAAFKAQAREAPGTDEIFKAGNRGYKLACSAFIIK